MTDKSAKIEKESFPWLELTDKPTLLITETLKKKIDWLHNKIGSTEWSGELITREEGSITNPGTWKVVAEDIFLTDIGSPGYTEYEVGKEAFKAPDIIELYQKFPGLETGELKLQHVHSHHNMSKNRFDSFKN